MPDLIFNATDQAALQSRGLDEDDARRQLSLFARPPAAAHLVRPCTAGDGILTLDKQQQERCEKLGREAAQKGRVTRFVPASGAATRMFKSLLKAHSEGHLTLADRQARAEIGDEGAEELVAFMQGLRRFAFFDDLKDELSRRGRNVETLIEQGDFTALLPALLDQDGLKYADQAKGLVTFHKYPKENRTALAEQLIEAALTFKDSEGRCRIHFTVAPAHQTAFIKVQDELREDLLARYGAAYKIGFSAQKKSTDTLAVNEDNTLFRNADGSLLFRAGGHGALLENLNDLDADLISIKNIDNVVQDRYKPETVRWKHILAGLLTEVQHRLFLYLRRLDEEGHDPEALRDAAAFLHNTLHLELPHLSQNALRDALNRPLRICGVVKNQGQAGGGPFWVKDLDGMVRPQIVESAQVNLEAPDQRDAFEASTHFNPVDIFCGVRDYRSEKFDLRRFREPSAVFISRKSKDGKPLKALELPGLWNGSMEYWLTLFVEVPSSTFNPVKCVTDLLKPEHQLE
jgi:hypothetical protein